MLNLGNIFKYQ